MDQLHWPGHALGGMHFGAAARWGLHSTLHFDLSRSLRPLALLPGFVDRSRALLLIPPPSMTAGTVLVTGASGYFGQHLVAAYARSGWQARAGQQGGSCPRCWAAAPATPRAAASLAPQVGATYLAGQEPRFEGNVKFFKVYDCRAEAALVAEGVPASFWHDLRGTSCGQAC